MNEFEIIFYKKEDGQQPAKDFVRSLDVKMRAKMLRCIEILKVNGNELRAKQGSDISRVLYFFVVGRKIILTNGFIKKTQKTPPKEIELAEKYREDYIQRFGKEM